MSTRKKIKVVQDATQKESVLPSPVEILKVVGKDSEGEDFEVEYGILPLNKQDTLRAQIDENIDAINAHLVQNDEILEQCEKENERLTNHADGLDYTIAVLSGVLTGLLDSFWISGFDFHQANKWGTDTINAFVLHTANRSGYGGNELGGAIRHLEKFGIPHDSNTGDFGGGRLHHLNDFAHHPTLGGLACSMFTQFSGESIGTDSTGALIHPSVRDKNLIGKSLPEKFVFGTIHWFFHVVSDVAGSSVNPGAGMGLPGPLLSFAKELSAIPFFGNINVGDDNFSAWISKLFQGKIIDGVRFDFRTELGVMHEIGKMSIPVMLNDCIVRSFYFIRSLVREIQGKDIRTLQDITKIEWNQVMPFGNRTITRMLTIATGTFTAVDLADAAIRGAMMSGGNAQVFALAFIVRVNFVGVGRFAVAVGKDVYMGTQRSKNIDKMMKINDDQLHWLNAKIYYKKAGMWLEASAATHSIFEAYVEMEKTFWFAHYCIAEIDSRIEKSNCSILPVGQTGMLMQNIQNANIKIREQAWRLKQLCEKTEKALEQAENAKREAKEASERTIGILGFGTKKAVISLQKSAKSTAEAVASMAEALNEALENQKELANISQNLFSFGIMSLDKSRDVLDVLKVEYEKQTVTKLAKLELEKVIKQIEEHKKDLEMQDEKYVKTEMMTNKLEYDAKRLSQIENQHKLVYKKFLVIGAIALTIVFILSVVALFFAISQ